MCLDWYSRQMEALPLIMMSWSFTEICPCNLRQITADRRWKLQASNRVGNGIRHRCYYERMPFAVSTQVRYVYSILFGFFSTLGDILLRKIYPLRCCHPSNPLDDSRQGRKPLARWEFTRNTMCILGKHERRRILCDYFQGVSADIPSTAWDRTSVHWWSIFLVPANKIPTLLWLITSHCPTKSPPQLWWQGFWACGPQAAD